MKNLFIVLFLGVTTYFGYVTFLKNDIYIGFVYLDGCLSCESKWIKSLQFKERKECLVWANNILAERNNTSDDFECAKNCKEKESGFNVCEETFDY